MITGEKELQENIEWNRDHMYADYNAILGHYQVVACLEHKRGTSLLDLPCGDGLLTSKMAPHFNRVVGVDASGKHLELARDRLPSAEFQEALIEEFSTPEKFDTITMINILEHVRDPVLVLQKAGELLAEGGVILAHVPNAHAINRKLAVSMGTLTDCEELSPFDINVAGHRRSYTLESLCRDVIDAGLKVHATGGVFYKSLSTPQMDWFLTNGPWKEGGFGWGRVGGPDKDWKAEFCRASYEVGKQMPEDCNVIYACIEK